MTNILATAAILLMLSRPVASSMDTNFSPQEAKEVAAQSVLANTAKILGISESKISLNSSFSDQNPPVDALDFVEIIMAVEDELRVSIDDSALEQLSGAQDPDHVASHLSVRQLQEFVGTLTLPRHPQIPTATPPKAPTDPLEPGDTGAYGQLAVRPNPNGHVIVTVPDVSEILPVLARERGKPLTPAEIEEIRSAAPSLVMSRDDAEKFQKLRAARPRQ